MILEICLIILSIIALVRKNIPFALLMLTVFYYTQWLFGTTTSDLIFYHNYSDIGIILAICIVVLLVRRTNQNSTNTRKLLLGVSYFFVFFCISLFVDLLYNNTPIISDLKAIRQWIPLILLIYANKIKPEEGICYFRYLIILIFCFSAIFIFEIFTNITITGAWRTMNGARASIPMPMALLCFSFLLYGTFGFSKKFRVIFIIVLITNIVLCGSRSFFISYIVVLLLFYLFGKLSIKKIGLLIVAIIAVIVIFNTENILSKRFESKDDGIEAISSGSKKVRGNLSFRLMHASERFDYIMETPQYAVFGIGYVEEKNLTKKIFTIGLLNEEGKVVQLDTMDIAWSTAFIRWGLFGTILFIVFFYFRFVKFYYQNKGFPIARCIFFYLITEILFISFTYTDVVTKTFWIPIIIGLSCYSEVDMTNKRTHKTLKLFP